MRPKGRALRALGVALFYALIGPLAGGAPIILLAAGNAAATDADKLGNSIAVLIGFTYLFGGAAALITGLWLGLRTWRRGTFGYGRAAVVGLVASLLSGIVFALAVSTPESGPSDASRGGGGAMGVFLVPFAVISALLCRWLVGKLGLIEGSRSGGSSAP